MAQFLCSGCGGYRLEQIMENVTVSTPVSNITEDGDCDYDNEQQTNENGTVVRYQCPACGEALTDHGEFITELSEVYLWCEK